MTIKDKGISNPALLSLKKWFNSFGPYVISIVLFAIYKLIYTQPIIFLDSKNYITWGILKLPVSYRPTGYSKFLRIFEGNSHNHLTVVFIQYFVFLIASFFFNKYIFKEFNFSRTLRIITYCLTIYNPIGLFLANMFTPDSLFLSFTIIWLLSLMMVINGKDKKYTSIGIHIISLFVLYNLRYNVVYYPIVTLLSLFICRRNIKLYLLAGSSFLLLFILYKNTIALNYTHTRATTFSAFGGWVIANNAIHLYDIADVDRDMWEKTELQKIHDYVVKYKDSVEHYNRGKEVSAVYMWDSKGPLKRYVVEKVEHREYPNYFLGWYGVSNDLAEFGERVILAYPFAFLRQFYIPNFLTFFYPGLEALGEYDPFDTELGPKQMEYLGIKNSHVLTDTTHIQHYTMIVTRILYIFISIIVIATIILVVIKTIQKNKIPHTIKLITLFYSVILALSILGHPIIVRYVSMLYITGSVLPLLYFAWNRQQKISTQVQE